MKITIGTNLKRLRTAKGITQEQLSVAMNVTCAAVSKWERGETYPDITLLQPLAYYFGVTLDELMGYDQEKVKAEIDKTMTLYRSTRDAGRRREIICQAYRAYPSDYRVMYSYMWDIGGDLDGNDPFVLISHKEEFLSICEKILAGCADEELRLGAWNMRAKILHAEGKTDEALEIYKTRFADWYHTGEQKSEQLFAKGTDEYAFCVEKNMYQLAAFASDKLGRTVFFNRALSMEEKAACALRCGNWMLSAFEETGEPFFLVIASSFLARMENDLCYLGGSDEDVAAVMEKHLFAAKRLEQEEAGHATLYHAFEDGRDPGQDQEQESLFVRKLKQRLEANGGRREELLKNEAYVSVLEKYR